ncbi:MAG TPA: serine hydrolase [Longimicrobiaceae bacterium]
MLRHTIAALGWVAFALVRAGHAPAQQNPDFPVVETDSVLLRELQGIVQGFDGKVGVYVRHLDSDRGVEIHADSLFPTASLIKVPLLVTLFDRIERGDLSLEGTVAYPDTLTYHYTEATDVVGYMEPGDTLPLSEVAFLMLSVSDNHASLWIQALVGGGSTVNEWLAGHGFRQTRVNSRTPGREAAREAYGWGQMTPREIGELLVMIREGRAVSPAASETMYRMLTSSYWRDVAVSQIPPTVQVASKQGFVSSSRSEVLLVDAPGGDYVLAVATRDQADTRWGPVNEGAELLRNISRAVYRHFNPDDAWRPGAATR